jgi:hypothetical protein
LIIHKLGVIRQPEQKMISEQKAENIFVSRHIANAMLAVRFSSHDENERVQKYKKLCQRIKMQKNKLMKSKSKLLSLLILQLKLHCMNIFVN